MRELSHPFNDTETAVEKAKGRRGKREAVQRSALTEYDDISNGLKENSSHSPGIIPSREKMFSREPLRLFFFFFFPDPSSCCHCVSPLFLLFFFSLHEPSTSFFSSFPSLFVTPSHPLFPLFLLILLLSLSGLRFVFFSVIMLPLSLRLSLYPSLSVTVCCSRVVESAGVTGNRVPWVLWAQLLGSGNCLHNRETGGLALSCPTFKRVCGCVWVCVCVCV